MKDKGPGDNKPNDDQKRQRDRKQWQKALAASQFAYTLVIATLLMGWLGQWLGSLLGGGLWSTILMFLLGTAGFVAEMWRMYKFFAPQKEDRDDDDDSGGQSGDAPSGTSPGAGRNEGPDGKIERPVGDDRRDNDGINHGDDVERPGESEDRVGGSGKGDGLTKEEIDEIIREIEGLSKEEREELDRELGNKTDGSAIEKNDKGSNE